MKRFVLLVVCGACLSWVASADPCTSGSLADYEGLATGCTIGTNFLSGFTTLSGISGATPIDPGTVSITPSGGSATPELLFTVSNTADANDLLEAIFTYKISGNPYTHSTITLSNSSETGDGAVTDIQNTCADGSFGPDGVSGCTGTVASLVALDGLQNEDDTPLAALSFLNVTDDFTFDGGTAGSATGGSFTDQFAAGVTVPEPKAVSFFAAFVLALAAICRRRSIKI